MAFTPSSVPSATNTFIPNAEATANLVTNFSRNPASFKLPGWASYTPASKFQGFYLRMNIDQCARVLDPKGNNNKWPRGSDAPELAGNLEAFGWLPFMCERYLYGYQLPFESAQQADFPVGPVHNAIEAQRAMTTRTQIAVTAATTAANFDASHVDTAADWGGGYLNAGTSTNPIFKIALEAMYRRIHRDTRGAVKPSDVVVLLNPSTANKIAQGAEIHDYLKGSPDAVAQMRGNVAGQNDTWGLPPTYSGFRIMVEDAVKNPNAVGAADQDGEYIWPWATVAMFARPGGLIAPEGSPSFSTVHVFLFEDMSVETYNDTYNRRETSRFVDDFDVRVVAPVAGALCTASLASEPISLVPASAEPNTFGPGIVTGEVEEMRRQIAEMARLFDEMRDENLRFREELSRRSATPELSPPERPPEGGQGNPADRKRR